jgi:hypothetical protein
MEILRSEDSVEFTPVGSAPYNGTANYSFTDNSISPGTRSYYYKVVIYDSCDNSRNESNVCRTIRLVVEQDQENIFSMHLSWNDYAGFGGGTSGYNIYRVVNEGAPEFIDSSAPGYNFYTDDIEDEAPRGARVEYMVQAVEGSGNPYHFSEFSNSNRVPVYMEGRLFIPTAFAPGGVNTTWRPVTHFIDKSDYHVTVFNRWGKKVFETRDDSESWNGDNCLPDVYAYIVSYKNARGEYKEVNGTVLLLR